MQTMRGYTLIELIVVIVMIALLAIFAIPAFSRYGDFIEYKNKVAEIKGFIEQTQVMAKNPEQGVLAYGLVVSAADQRVSLQKCTDVACADAPSVIRTVDLTNTSNKFGTQALWLPDGVTGSFSLICQSKAQDGNCFTSIGAADGYFSLHYSSSKVNRTAIFNIRTVPSFRLTIDNTTSS